MQRLLIEGIQEVKGLGGAEDVLNVSSDAPAPLLAPGPLLHHGFVCGCPEGLVLEDGIRQGLGCLALESAAHSSCLKSEKVFLKLGTADLEDRPLASGTESLS